jgi:CubicO group peptidase (beta-lactamase class C family)
MSANVGEALDQERGVACGFDPERLQRALDFCAEATTTGRVPGICLIVARGSEVVVDQAWGIANPGPDGRAAGDPIAATPETVWLIASLTKPVVCAGICLLMERGLLALDDLVSRWIPEFDGRDRAATTLRHLLTHSSGLPDMLPENVFLRERHAPHSEFVRRICATPLLFPPGTDVRYQSAGIALLGDIIERVTDEPCREFLRRELLLPLGMTDSCLGWRPELEDRVALYPPDEGQVPSDWDWNSAYWRGFGAPWGGMYSTPRQYLRFLHLFLNGGVCDGRQVMGRATAREMVRNQTADLPDLTAPARPRSTWGLGFRVAAGRESDYLGDLLGPRAFGHAGATGTVAWCDPDTGVTMVCFSNRPSSGRWLGLLSNTVAGAIRD